MPSDVESYAPPVRSLPPQDGLLEAILLVGGQGTRLRPLTIGTPKPLLPTAGVPFLAHQLARAADSGVRRIVLATAYRSEMFAEVFGDGSRYGLEIVYADEAEPLGTGGGIRNAAQSLLSGPDDPVVVLNGDVLSGHDLGAQINLHRRLTRRSRCTWCRCPTPRFGCVPTDLTAGDVPREDPAPGDQPGQRQASSPGGSLTRCLWPGAVGRTGDVPGLIEALRDRWVRGVGLPAGRRTPEAVRGSCDPVLANSPVCSCDHAVRLCCSSGPRPVGDLSGGRRSAPGAWWGRAAVGESVLRRRNHRCRGQRDVQRDRGWRADRRRRCAQRRRDRRGRRNWRR